MIFGYIGDNVSRKATVIIATTMMALSCITIAMLPTYAQIGITASYVVTICRIVQGISSMGEIVGAQLYLTEFIKPPIQYPAVAFTSNFSTSGSMAALAVGLLALSIGFNSRYAFFIGAGIAIVGSFARTALRETPVFVDTKRRITVNKNN